MFSSEKELLLFWVIRPQRPSPRLDLERVGGKMEQFQPDAIQDVIMRILDLHVDADVEEPSMATDT